MQDKYTIIVHHEAELIIHGERHLIPKKDLENEDALHYEYDNHDVYEQALEDQRKNNPGFGMEKY